VLEKCWRACGYGIGLTISIADCCPRAALGHAAAAPPKKRWGLLHSALLSDYDNGVSVLDTPSVPHRWVCVTMLGLGL
jgi:hypothetical protein